MLRPSALTFSHARALSSRQHDKISSEEEKSGSGGAVERLDASLDSDASSSPGGRAVVADATAASGGGATSDARAAPAGDQLSALSAAAAVTVPLASGGESGGESDDEGVQWLKPRPPAARPGPRLGGAYQADIPLCLPQPPPPRPAAAAPSVSSDASSMAPPSR